MTQVENPDMEQATEQTQEEVYADYEATPESVPAQPARRPLTQSFILRLLLVAVVVILVIGLIALIAFDRMRASRNQPIEYDVYPNATLLNESKADNADQRNYSTKDPIESVFVFYRERLGELQYRTAGGELGEDKDRGCRKIYDSEQPSNDPGRYFVRCIVDNSQTDISQTLLITISYSTAEQVTYMRFDRRWGN